MTTPTPPSAPRLLLRGVAAGILVAAVWSGVQAALYEGADLLPVVLLFALPVGIVLGLLGGAAARAALRAGMTARRARLVAFFAATLPWMILLVASALGESSLELLWSWEAAVVNLLPLVLTGLVVRLFVR